MPLDSTEVQGFTGSPNAPNSEGMYFDGNDDYINLGELTWGGMPSGSISGSFIDFSYSYHYQIFYEYK